MIFCFSWQNSSQFLQNNACKSTSRTRKSDTNRIYTNSQNTLSHERYLTANLILKGKGKGAYSSSWNSPQNYGTSLVNRITQYYLPPDRGDRPAFPPTGHVGTRFIDPRKDERLSWPSWLVTYRNGLPVHRRSPIRVLTGSDVPQLRWSKPTRYL